MGSKHLGHQLSRKLSTNSALSSHRHLLQITYNFCAHRHDSRPDPVSGNIRHHGSDHLPTGSHETFTRSSLLDKYRPKIIKGKRFRSDSTSKNNSAKLTRIEEDNLAVKWGPDLSLAEFQCQWYARKLLMPYGIPVPETYGWRRYDGCRFLYMELVPGRPYYDLNMENLVDSDTKKQIAHIIHEWIAICEGVVPKMCEPVSSPSSRDDHLYNRVYPFRSLGPMEAKGLEVNRVSPEPPRPPFHFAHGGLHGHNIMLESDACGGWRISGLLDWEKGGWYPKGWQRNAWCERRKKLASTPVAPS